MPLSRFITRETRQRLLYWYSFRIPSFLTYVALFALAVKAFDQFFSHSNFVPVFTWYATAIATATGLASVTFAYARVKSGEEQDSLVSTGELFLNAATSLILSLLVTWVSLQTSMYLAAFSYYGKIRWLLTILFVWGQSFLVVAAFSIHGGLTQLDEQLYFKLSKKMRVRIGPSGPPRDRPRPAEDA